MSNRHTFKNRNEFHRWLIRNHNINDGIWLVFGKGGKLETLHPNEALEEALCFGWIDGLIKRVDDISYIKRFTPRRKGSQWSERNKNFAKKLIDSGLMTEYGFLEIKKAKKSGKWTVQKKEPVTEIQIEILVSAINGIEPALSNFKKMSPSVQKTYAAFYLDAKKEETKIRRINKIIDRLNNNLKPM